uniref:Ras association domain family member 6 n=1 Tax=Terrapene triunguis TaxID=2587831 RepID=A0A674IIV5_9SAUR
MGPGAGVEARDLGVNGSCFWCVPQDPLVSRSDAFILFHSGELLLFCLHGNTQVIEGILAIFWGVRCPIWLKIQDEKQIPPFVTLRSPERVGLLPSKRGMMRWGEVHNLHHISEEIPDSSEEPPNHEEGCFSYESSTLKPRRVPELNSLTPHRTRTLSDAAQVRKRENSPTIARKDVETHRFSINGHFYNYETSVFTPAFGSETKIRINSNMKTGEVIEQLLQKFKIENSPQEFALYIIHASGEKKRLKNTDTPLLERLLQGPSEKIAQFFLMDKNAEEVTSDVAQYLKFHVPLLESFLHKLDEEEEREIQQTIAKLRLGSPKWLLNVSPLALCRT